MNASDVVINGLGGAFIALAGCFLISLFRVPKLLDRELNETIDRQSQKIADLQVRKRNPADDYKQNQVRQSIANLDEDHLEILRWLIHKGHCRATEIRDHFGYHRQDSIQRAISAGKNGGWINVAPDPRRGGLDQQWTITENYRSALEAVLHDPPQPVTPLPE